MGSGARADAALFSVLGVGLALGLRLTCPPPAQWKVTLAGLGILAVSASASSSRSGHAAVTTEGFPGTGPPVADGWNLLLDQRRSRCPTCGRRPSGAGPMASLGWFDTPVPWAVGVASLVGVRRAALHRLDAPCGGRRLVALVCRVRRPRRLPAHPAAGVGPVHRGQGAAALPAADDVDVRRDEPAAPRRASDHAEPCSRSWPSRRASRVAQSDRVVPEPVALHQGHRHVRSPPSANYDWWWETLFLTPTGRLGDRAALPSPASPVTSWSLLARSGDDPVDP